MLKKILILSFLVSILFFINTPVLPVQGNSGQEQEDSQVNTLIDTKHDGYAKGNYSINDLLGLVIRASKYILGLVGALTLLIFVYGGVMFLVSAGNQESVKKAKDILTAAIVGLVIVFASFLIIKFVLSVLGVDWEGKFYKIPPPSNNS